MAANKIGHSSAALDFSKQRVNADKTCVFREVASRATGETTVATKFAFAFDIDGVLVRGGQTIPEVFETTMIFNGQNDRKIKM